MKTAKSNKKKRSPIVFFFAAFFAIVIIMFIANRKSVLVEKIRFPFNNGVAALSTYRNFLVAVCLDNKVWVWDWDNLSKGYKVGFVQSHQAALLKSGMVVSLRQRNPKALVVTNLKGDRKHKEILLDSNSELKRLAVNRSGGTIALLLAENRDSETAKASYKLMTVDIDADRTYPVVEIAGEAAESQLRDLAVSDDGAFMVLVGEKNNCGWIVLVDAKQKQVVWEKEVMEVRLFFSAVFSTDNKVIYTRGSDSTLYEVETASGRIVRRLLPVKENKNTLMHSSTQAVVVSPDGKLVAAIVSGVVYVWDCRTGEKIFGKTPGHKIESGLAFSPDSRFLATSDLRQGGTIKIWRMPGR